MDPNEVWEDLSTSPCQVSKPTAKPCQHQPGSTRPPELQNQCPGSRQGCWVPFQKGSDKSQHSHHCLSFPLSLSLPDLRRWLLRRAGTCHRAGRGQCWVHLRQDPACIPLQWQPRFLSPLVHTGATGLLCPRHGGTKNPPTHSCPILHLALRSSQGTGGPESAGPQVQLCGSASLSP